MNFRTTCQEHNDIGYAEATYDECEDACPRCDGGDFKEEDCCQPCQDELDEWSQEFAREERLTRRGESCWG